MIVLDAGVWVRALADSSSLGDVCRAEMRTDSEWAAPAHTPLEVLRTLRPRCISNALSSPWMRASPEPSPHWASSHGSPQPARSEAPAAGSGRLVALRDTAPPGSYVAAYEPGGAVGQGGAAVRQRRSVLQAASPTRIRRPRIGRTSHPAHLTRGGRAPRRSAPRCRAPSPPRAHGRSRRPRGAGRPCPDRS